MATLNEIERITKIYSDRRKALADKVQAAEDEIAAIKRRHLPGIRKAAQNTSESYTALHSIIEEAPELFKKPKTVTLHGIRLGFKKEKGKLEWDNDDRIIKLIKKIRPEDWDAYINVTEKPKKAALEQLTAADLKKIGIQVTEDTEEVFIKSTDSEIDKLVAALLKDEDESLQAMGDKEAA
jgi:arsenate reductase-like glutaredoxin family protein